MNTIDLVNLIQSRRSIRAWQDKPVPEDLLLRAVELATYAPNAGNQQNWFFYIILKKDVINAIADVVQASADKVASWPETAKFGETVDRMLKRSSLFRAAPAAIAVAASQYQSAVEEILALREVEDPELKDEGWRNIANSKIQSVSSAIAYLLLILHQMELGGLWMTGPMQAKGEIEQILQVPQGMDLVAFIPVGYPAENPPPKARKDVKEVTRVIK